MNKTLLKDIIKEAFLITHDSYSIDDVIINDVLNEKFITEVNKRIKEHVIASGINMLLLNLRKAGSIGSVTTKRILLKNQEDYEHACQIAARIMEDKYDITIDRVFCDVEKRIEFDEIASNIAPGYSSYEYRKTALKLRKSSKLTPELFKRVLTGGKHIYTTVNELLDNPEKIPPLAGVYIFINGTGVLYIGEASNLKKRVLKHLDHSDRKSLAHYFWENQLDLVKIEIISFDENSPVTTNVRVRRGLEANLIESRTPRFNIL